MKITEFIEQNFKHFNSRELVDAAKAYKNLLEQDGKMMITLAGAMSTAELGISLAE
ncbi:MAG: deoxyhypusine synthase, partial [Patescibacteria group bacterium]